MPALNATPKDRLVSFCLHLVTHSKYLGAGPRSGPGRAFTPTFPVPGSVPCMPTVLACHLKDLRVSGRDGGQYLLDEEDLAVTWGKPARSRGRWPGGGRVPSPRPAQPPGQQRDGEPEH